MIFRRLIGKKEWRQFYLYRLLHLNAKRGEGGALKFLGKTLFFHDFGSFLGAYYEIFANGIYDFESSTESPVIFDVGANIGLATIFFKLKYPNAKIIAIEADPKIYAVLKKNIESFGFDNVTVLNVAAWTHDTEIFFMQEGGDGGRVSASGVAVRAVSLSNMLSSHNHIDFLKIDIEGGERLVFETIKDQLVSVQNIFCEYHSEPNNSQDLEKILAGLSHAGFRYYIKTLFSPASPYKKIEVSCGFDMQANIFGTRIIPNSTKVSLSLTPAAM
ncbi:putative methyltransferase, FkbM family [Rhodoferax antarcticus ANT.BR]|uniref:Putative methyltransferase, FkbM family n=1 Tax=Rhodoferax antarcticus ANT.BR TaxID=1111071 RepID=A0A1Q8YJA7_9BURK|nr:putative methyltransferase, FkbM family [Rhodoferax antarcticus ANT.BR]